jgi:thiol-disulfide isomerase/thioredoxin
MQPLERSLTEQNYLVKGTINGEFDDVIKIKYNDNIDSAKVLNNTFQFEGELSSPTAFRFQFDSLSASQVFYLENDTLRFDIIVDEVIIENDTFQNYQVKQLSGGQSKDLIAYTTSFLKSTPKSKMKRSVIKTKVDSLIKAHPNHDYLGKLLSELSMKQDLLYNDIGSLLSKLDRNELNDTDLKILDNFQEKRKRFQIGSQLPDYELISITSKKELLKSKFSKYNLIRFWNSWCVECKSDTAELKNLYQKYNYKSFEIFDVSIDPNHEDWISAIYEDTFPWTSLRVENGATGNMPSEMGIVDLPQYYLVDQNGRILEINLNMTELDTILNALLN